VGDDAHAKVRKILASNGDVYTVAGNGTFGFSGDGGLAKNAELGGGPGGLSLDSSNNLYISDGSRLRKVTASTGIIKTIAGPSGFSFSLRDSFEDSSGNVFVTDYFGVVHKVAPNGTVTNVIGTGTYAFGGDGGPATSASFKSMWGLARDASGNIYVAD